MTIKERVRREYFDWMLDKINADKKASFHKVLKRLNDIEFTWQIPLDKNRAEDGIDLRDKFIYYTDKPESLVRYLDGPCSMLEMMVALADRCEETMEDAEIGDRTGQWFWRMMTNLGLGGMYDSRYDRRVVDSIVNGFLERQYDSNGHGGLFIVRNPPDDLRNVEIWYQLNWYLAEIT